MNVIAAGQRFRQRMNLSIYSHASHLRMRDAKRFNDVLCRIGDSGNMFEFYVSPRECQEIVEFSMKTEP